MKRLLTFLLLALFLAPAIAQEPPSHSGIRLNAYLPDTGQTFVGRLARGKHDFGEAWVRYPDGGLFVGRCSWFEIGRREAYAEVEGWKDGQAALLLLWLTDNPDTVASVLLLRIPEWLEGYPAVPIPPAIDAVQIIGVK